MGILWLGASVSEPGEGPVLGDTLSQDSLVSPTATLSICCPREPPSSLCGWTYYGQTPDTGFWVFLIHFIIHSKKNTS